MNDTMFDKLLLHEHGLLVGDIRILGAVDGNSHGKSRCGKEKGKRKGDRSI
jgi:hypothetical protein